MRNLLVTFVTSALFTASVAFGQGTTDWYQVSQVLPPEGGASAEIDRLGGDMVIFGNRLATTISWASSYVHEVGFVYRFENGTWSEQAPLLTESDTIAFAGSPGRIAADGSFIGIGSPSSNSNDGVAVVFRYDDLLGEWIEDAWLSAMPPQENAAFGSSLAIQGNLLAIGAHSENNDGLYAGAVYMFKYTNEQWTLQQKLIDPSPHLIEQFGAAVAFFGSKLLVGAPAHSTYLHEPGKVVVFNFLDEHWQYESTITASDGYPGDRFGNEIAVHNDLIAVAAPDSEDEMSINTGAVYLFRESERSDWFEIDRLAPPIREADSRAGRAIAIDESTVLIGAQSFDDGGTFHYTTQSGSWSYLSMLCPVHDGHTTSEGFGTSVEVYANQLLIGAPTFRRDDNGRGAIFVYAQQPIDDTDCNDNGIPDACEPDDDCNSNGIADICDIATGFGDCNGDGVLDVCELAKDANDCNTNGIPDLCEINHGTVLDCNANGTPDMCEFSEGKVDDCNTDAIPDDCQTWDYELKRRMYTGGWYYNVAQDAIRLNQFEIRAGAEWINSVTFVSFPWSNPVPFTIVFYDDPENDGDPNGSTLIREVRPIATAASSSGWQRFVVPPTYVGEAGESFFIGVVTIGEETPGFDVWIDSRLPLEGRTWTGLVSQGNTIHLDPLGGFDQIPLSPHDERVQFAFLAGSWRLRADGTHFQGVPTDCACPADISGPARESDTDVNVFDLLEMLASWGGCDEPCAPFCTGDIAGPNDLPDCIVDAHDVIALLNNWGACPK